MGLLDMRNGKYYLVFWWEGNRTLRWVDFEVTPVFLERRTATRPNATARLGAA